MRFVVDKATVKLYAEEYYEPIYKFCCANLNYNSHDAQDVTQEVFLLFQLKYHELDDENIKAWLFSTASYKIKELLKKKGVAQKHFTSLEYYDTQADNDDIFELLDDQLDFDSEKLQKYRSIIFEKLSAKEQLLYTKAFVENKPYAKIAEEFNTTENNICVRIFRLKKKIGFMQALMLCTIGQFIFKLLF